MHRLPDRTGRRNRGLSSGLMSWRWPVWQRVSTVAAPDRRRRSTRDEINTEARGHGDTHCGKSMSRRACQGRRGCGLAFRRRRPWADVERELRPETQTPRGQVALVFPVSAPLHRAQRGRRNATRSGTQTSSSVSPCPRVDLVPCPPSPPSTLIKVGARQRLKTSAALSVRPGQLFRAPS